MKRLFIFIMALALYCSGAAAADKPVLRVAVDAPYPPFAMVDEEGRLTGFDVDIALALCKEMKRECEVKAIPFDSLLPEIVAGTIDIAVAGMGASEERSKLVDFTERYFRSLSVFIERAGTLKELTPESIKGLHVGTQEDTLQSSYLQKTYGDNITLVTVASYTEIFSMLKKGEVDLVLVDGLPGYNYLKSEDGAGLETIGEPIESGSVMDWASIAVSKTQPGLRDALNAAIQAIRRNGEYGKINRKYFDFNIY